MLLYPTVACLFCLFVLVGFKVHAYILVCPFGWVVCLFFVFVLAHFSHSNLHCLFVAESFETRIPRFAQFFVLVVRFFLLWGLGHYILVICFLFCLLFLFFRLFFEHFMLFSLFWRFDHFCSVRLFSLFSFFFLFFLVRMHRGRYMRHWGVPGHPLHTHNSLVWSVTLMCRPRHPCQAISSIHPCRNYDLWTYLCLCLPCFAFAGC